MTLAVATYRNHFSFPWRFRIYDFNNLHCFDYIAIWNAQRRHTRFKRLNIQSQFNTSGEGSREKDPCFESWIESKTRDMVVGGRCTLLKIDQG